MNSAKQRPSDIIGHLWCSTCCRYVRQAKSKDGKLIVICHGERWEAPFHNWDGARRDEPASAEPVRFDGFAGRLLFNPFGGPTGTWWLCAQSEQRAPNEAQLPDWPEQAPFLSQFTLPPWMQFPPWLHMRNGTIWTDSTSNEVTTP